MAKYGEWNQKGATLSDKTAKKEYGVDRDYIIDGINTGKLEYRHASAHGNPYIKILRRQLEEYMAETHGKQAIQKITAEMELKKIKTEISTIQNTLMTLNARKIELESLLH